MRVARLIAAAATLALALAAPARADLEAGLAAYDAEDWATALHELLPEAEAGNAEAQYRVGRIYRMGLGVPADVSSAIRWYEAGARNGSNKAMYGLGRLFKVGEQVPRDLERAECWHRHAADRGHSAAQYVLATMLSDRFELAEAAYWRERAIAQGQPNALYCRGSVLLLNPLVKDKTEGYMLVLLAADRDLPKAIEKADRIRQLDLSGESRHQFEEARQLAYAWQEKAEQQVTEPPSIPSDCFGS